MIAVLALWFAGCSSMMVREASLRNLSHHDLQNLSIVHVPTQRIATGVSVPKDTSYDLGINNRPLLGKQALLKWSQSDGQQLEATVDLPTKRSVEHPKNPHLLVYRIFPDGRVSVHLEP